MAYEHFYRYYDHLMSDIPYQEYLTLLKSVMTKEMTILDLGCGTGNLLVPLVKEGYQVDGVDLNDTMLLIAHEKLHAYHLDAHLFCDDMRNLNRNNYYDVIFCLIDTIHYLPDELAITDTLKGVYASLKENGAFVFDIHNKPYIEDVFDHYSYHETFDEMTYLWDTFLNSSEHFTEIHHDLSFYIKNNSFYKRYDETHKQVVFSLNFYIEKLTDIGFKDIIIYSDFTKGVNKHATKYQIICRK